MKMKVELNLPTTQIEGNYQYLQILCSVDKAQMFISLYDNYT